ncbi:MAG: amidohydrolase family protein [Phaeodactylibacter xiamenensis]|uniref:Amidohydrolase n=1 Tax=Phaeodactylibacter xiamenensis TaxID=1524460 RepID=A0A098S242_9BACT|nr:amidohydrolase family protein [Phaeodactylibacter xiamenensis]KGE85237.1 amidohydrolase [Phaeodactylibacter xiamenensis]MCR9054010.1 amidohydrolase family protein [bacterium]
MRIDAHQHFWEYDPVAYPWISEAMPKLRKDHLPTDLSPLLKEEGIGGCVAVQARQSPEETDFLLHLTQQYAFIKGVVGWIDLQAPDVAQTLGHYQSNPLLKGIRHIVQDEPDDEFLLRPDFLRGVQKLGQQGYTYDILVFERHLPVVLKFLDACPDQPFVLDHLGKPTIEGGPSPLWKDHIRSIAAHPNVYCKLSGLVTEADWNNWQREDFYPFLDIAMEAFGPERLMIGSDWPVCLLAADSYHETVNVVQMYLQQYAPEAQPAILGATATQFYQLN